MKRAMLLGLVVVLMAAASAYAQEEAPPDVVPPEVVAQAYVGALYRGDEDAQRALAPRFQVPDPSRHEAEVTLDTFSGRALTREEAQDVDPFSEWQYAEVTTAFSSGDRHGRATYLVGLLPRPNGEILDLEGRAVGLMVAMTSGAMQWDPPAPAPAALALRYNPSGPDRDCKDFATHAEAQAFFEAAQKATGQRDRHRLDADNNGLACEALP